jgi:anti-anti-sigma regulatory factor
MPFSITGSEAGQILKLAGAVTIRHAQDLATLLGQNLEDGLPLAVDTTGLEDIDTCILQLLYSLRKSVTAVSFDNPSDAFLSAVDRCALRREWFGIREDL